MKQRYISLDCIIICEWHTSNSMNDLDINDVKAVERYLFRLSADEGIGESELEGPCNVQLEVLEAGQWIIKFRRHGIIVNNCELVLRDGIKIDASISFFTLGNFWATINGGMTLEEGAMSTSGSEIAMYLFRTKILKSKAVHTLGIPSTPMATPRVPRPTSIEEDKLPLRSGWLLKKRDLFTGWRSRYFKVYIGRVEYFVEPGDPVPRATIDLSCGKVTPAAEIRINGQGRSYQIIVEPKKSEKCFKLASELIGEDGKQDAESWYMAFEIATKPPAQARMLLSGTKASPLPADKTSSPMKSDMSAAGKLFDTKKGVPKVAALKARGKRRPMSSRTNARIVLSVLSALMAIISVALGLCRYMGLGLWGGGRGWMAIRQGGHLWTSLGAGSISVLLASILMLTTPRKSDDTGEDPIPVVPSAGQG